MLSPSTKRGSGCLFRPQQNAVYLRASGVISLEAGVARMARWARRVGTRQSGAFKTVEVLRNMLPSCKAALENGEQE